jgi:hypothetical protein
MFARRIGAIYPSAAIRQSESGRVMTSARRTLTLRFHDLVHRRL